MTRIALVMLFACVMTLPPLMTIAAAPPSDGPFVIIHPPWVDGGAAVLQAGGQPIGLSDTRITTLAAATDPAVFVARMQKTGIRLVVAAERLPFLCTEIADPTEGSAQGARRDQPLRTIPGS